MKRFLSICCFLLFTLSIVAQSPLEKVIDFSVYDLPLDKTLNYLMEVADVDIAFSHTVLSVDRRITVRIEQQTVGYVLGYLLRGEPVGVELVGEQILLIPKAPEPERRFTVSGYLSDASSGEPLIGANVYSKELNKGTTTNPYGFYSLTLPVGSWQLSVSYLGYQLQEPQFNLSADLELDLELEPSLTLDSIVITARPFLETNQSTPLGTNIFIPEEMEVLPTLGGEADVIRLAYTMPGVQTGADGYGGLSVRGGNVDQNLILLDGVPVYNPSHLLGIYSVFNGSAIRSAKLIKGGFSARYGGRVSSVLDVRTKEGNNKAYEVEGDIGLTSGKFSVEGPIVKEKSSFFVSARRSFIDLYSRPVSRRLRELNGSNGELGYYFYDVNAKFNAKIGKKDHIYFSVYNGGDNYSNQIQYNQVLGDTTVVDDYRQLNHWGNSIASLRWNHQFGSKVFSNATLTYSRFSYDSEDLIERVFFNNFQPVSEEYIYFTYKSNNRDIAGKIDFDYVPTLDHYIRFGVSFIQHRFQPGAVQFDETVQQKDSLDAETINVLLNKNPLYSNEFDFYVEDEWKPTSWMTLNAGIRTTLLHVNDLTRFYAQPRLRLSVRPFTRLELNAALDRSIQSLHLLSASGIGLPRDLWVSATQRIAPIEAWQYSGGLRYFLDEKTEVSVEGYYKTLDNLITFQEGSLAEIDGVNWQNKVVVGEGWSYGGEFLLRRHTGKTTGWFSYTYSFAERQFEEVNLGFRYPFKLDRRHNTNLMIAHAFNERWTASFSWTYASGAATTVPVSKYVYNQLNLLYSDFPPQFPFVVAAFDNGRRNDIRLPDYHRMDVQVNWQIPRTWGNQTLSFGIYNVYNRLNPFNYILADRLNDAGEVVPQYLQISLVPILPSVRYRVQITR